MEELKSNYKDYVSLRQQTSSDGPERIAEKWDREVKELEAPVMMFIQVADSGKPKWQTYSNQVDGDLQSMREVLAPAFSNLLLHK